jgi:hypothetical protein
MLSVASRCSGQVYACDSKREYLCSIVGSCLYKSESVTITSKIVDVLLLLGKKTMRSLRIILLFTLHTLLNAIICCLQHNTERVADANRKVDY